MNKIGFSGSCPNGDISVLSDQIRRLKEVGIDTIEVPIYETDVICGKKLINLNLRF